MHPNLNNPQVARALDHFIERMIRVADAQLKKAKIRRPERKVLRKTA